MHIEVDPKASAPPSEQIAEQVRLAVAGGRLAVGERLPSVRGLATQALVNPNTVARAYRELERDGTVQTRPGSGVFVAPRAPEKCRKSMRRVIARRIERVVAEALSAGIDPSEVQLAVERALAADASSPSLTGVTR